MDFSFRQLQAFLQVARLKNFTRAAERVHVSQAGLSAMIQELERQVDCRLFDRTTRAVTLTSAGLEFLPVAERVVEELVLTTARIGRTESSSKRTLTVSTTPLLAGTLIPKVCSTFRELRPDISVRIRDVDRGRVQELVEIGDCDLGLGVFFKPVSGIERSRIYDFTLVLVSRKDSHKDLAPSDRRLDGHIEWECLREMPLIGLPPDNPTQRIVDAHLERIGRADEERPYFNSLQTVLAMVEAGFGSAVLPSFVLGTNMAVNFQLAALDRPNIPLPFYKITKKGRIQPEAANDFIRCFIEVANIFYGNSQINPLTE